MNLLLIGLFHMAKGSDRSHIYTFLNLPQFRMEFVKLVFY